MTNTTVPIKGKRAELLRKIAPRAGSMSTEQAGNILDAMSRLGLVEIEEEPEKRAVFGDYDAYRVVQWPSSGVYELRGRDPMSANPPGEIVLWSSDKPATEKPDCAPLRIRLLKSVRLAPCSTITLIELHNPEQGDDIGQELLRMQSRGDITNVATIGRESIWAITDQGRKALMGA